MRFAATTALGLFASMALTCADSREPVADCVLGTFQFRGTIDGTRLLAAYSAARDFRWINASPPPGTLDVGFGTDGHLHLEWQIVVADRQTVPATGAITMPSEGPHAGATYCIAAATLTPHTATGEGVYVEVTSLATGPCPGVGVTGTFNLCADPRF